MERMPFASNVIPGRGRVNLQKKPGGRTFATAESAALSLRLAAHLFDDFRRKCDILGVLRNIGWVERGTLKARDLAVHNSKLVPKLRILHSHLVELRTPLLYAFLVLMIVIHERIFTLHCVLQHEPEKGCVPYPVDRVHPVHVWPRSVVVVRIKNIPPVMIGSRGEPYPGKQGAMSRRRKPHRMRHRS